MKRVAFVSGWLLLLAAGFTLATILGPRAEQWGERRAGGVLQALLGDGRRIFANHFFVQADVYFHSGYYPSVFDRSSAPADTRHLTAAEDHDHVHGHGTTEADDHDHGRGAEEEHEKAMAFLGRPRDWIERFGRHFMITEHTHLQQGKEREMLPLLKLSAELDPQRIETYTVAAYWLRSRLGKVREAEAFLRDGLRHNPTSYELLFELGRLYKENYQDTARALKLWEAALRRWREQETGKQEPNTTVLEQIVIHLARGEESLGHWGPAIEYLELARNVSPNPAVLQAQIEELKRRLEGK